MKTEGHVTGDLRDRSCRWGLESHASLETAIIRLEMANNFSFGLVALSEVNEILVLLAQTIVAFLLYPIILG